MVLERTRGCPWQGVFETSHGGRMRSGNLKVVGSNPDLTFSNPGRVKQMTLKIDTCRSLAWRSVLLE